VVLCSEIQSGAEFAGAMAQSCTPVDETAHLLGKAHPQMANLFNFDVNFKSQFSKYYNVFFQLQSSHPSNSKKVSHSWMDMIKSKGMFYEP